MSTTSRSQSFLGYCSKMEKINWAWTPYHWLSHGKSGLNSRCSLIRVLIATWKALMPAMVGLHPPLHKDKGLDVTSDLYASFPGLAVGPLPEAARHRKCKNFDNEEDQTRHDSNDTTAKHCKSHSAETRAGGHQQLGSTKWKRLLERNWLAASRCQQKKKERMQFLESRL